MRSSSQLPLPLPARCSFSRDDFIVAPENERAVAFVEGWPDWPTRIAALYGPPGCGKTHLTSIWKEKSGTGLVSAKTIGHDRLQPGESLAIEDVDTSEASPTRDAALFALLESGAGSVLLTGRTPPATWPCVLPDLASRFSSLTTIVLQAPGEELLAALARKLFSDRQLFVPDAIIETMLRRLDRSAAAIRDFVEELDAAALAKASPVSLALVRNLLAAREAGVP
jgi:chromosomal replication initiation ATPase DnaA